jgi:hypothetical protein
VTLGQFDGGLWLIEAGLRSDDWVVVEGTHHLKSGGKVAPRQVPMPHADD